ncbi:ABC transporter ATP-binding protein [Nocardiopsis sp. CA-288880]|uniref:ABC transporter ATP-binding protein n=1 Tax=Nocardiopsis sp. CA-288880 TaxID=3239995 RepID=UPI003D991CA4
MRDTLRAVWELTRLSWSADRARLLGAAALMLAAAVAQPLTALALGVLTDAAVAGETERAGWAGALAGLLMIVAFVGAHFAHVLYMELGDKAFLRLDRELIGLSNGSEGLEHHERPEYADRITVLRQELSRVSTSGMTALMSGLSLMCGLVITVVLLVELSPWLLLLPLAAVPPLLTGRYAETLMARRRRRAAPHTRGAQHVLELTGDAATAKELRVLGMRDFVQDRHAEHWRAATRLLWGGETRAVLVRVAGQLVFASAYLAGTLLVVREAVAAERTVGDVVLAVVLAAQVSQQVSGVVALLQELQRLSRTLADLRWVRALIGRREDRGGQPPAEVPARLSGGIRFRGVSFRYPDREEAVLDGVDLWIPAGSVVAVVGENGAGKSTLVKLLSRFYLPTAGTIEIDGADLRHLPVERWRARITAGFQDFSRFELTAGETVGVGDLPRLADADAVDGALRRAGAGAVVRDLPSGAATPLGHSLPGGVQLSGGQWQKLALGRTMMREEPLLLMLDEPTAALDARAEHQLFEGYARTARAEGLRNGAVTLLVSHRFSTVRTADLILVLADGRIAESGSHDDLMGRRGLYSELYRLQAEQYRQDPPPGAPGQGWPRQPER